MSKAINIDVEMSELTKKLPAYLARTKRTCAEAVNNIAFDIAYLAWKLTKSASKETISNELNQMSSKYPDVPLKNILVNFERGKKGKPGLFGSKQETAGNRFVRQRRSRTKFLASGWVAPMEKFSPFKKGGKKGIKRKGRKFGGGITATGTWSPTAWIWNSVFGAKGKSNTEVQPIKEAGVAKAVRGKNEDLAKYIKSHLPRWS